MCPGLMSHIINFICFTFTCPALVNIFSKKRYNEGLMKLNVVWIFQ